MARKAKLLAEENISTPESIENLDTTIPKSEDSSPPDTTNNIAKPERTALSKIRNFFYELTQPSISMMDVVTFVLVMVFIAWISQDICNQCKKRGQVEARKSCQLPPVSVIRTPWTQDDIPSLEQLLEYKMRSKIPSPINMNQRKRQEEPRQGQSAVQKPSLLITPHDMPKDTSPSTLKCVFILLVFGFYAMWKWPKEDSTLPVSPEQVSAVVKGYHIEVNQPGNYTVAVPSVWSAASTSAATETTTATTTQEITKTITETATE